MYFGRVAGVIFALALMNYRITGASAISLASAYAIADVLKFNHSSHRKPGEARVDTRGRCRGVLIFRSQGADAFPTAQ
jgi:hypothetical protein